MIWQRKKITLQYTTKMIINFSRYSYFKIGLSDWFSWHMGGSFFHQLFKLLTLQKILLKTGNLLYDIVTCKNGNRQTLTADNVLRRMNNALNRDGPTGYILSLQAPNAERRTAGSPFKFRDSSNWNAWTTIEILPLFFLVDMLIEQSST